MAPFIWRIIPDRIKASVFYRFIYSPKRKWEFLYDSASLEYAPGVVVSLVPSDIMHGSIAFLGYYEKELSEAISDIASEEGGLFVDVGANIGYFSLIWVSQCTDKNKAIAIEASPEIIPLLKENVNQNDFDNKISIKDFAVGETNGELLFDLGHKNQTGWGGQATESSERLVTVHQYRLDEIIQEEISLLKIDTEGSDTFVLKGAENLLKSKKIKHIVFEHNLERAKALEIIESEPVEFLESLGYKVFKKYGGYWAEPK